MNVVTLLAVLWCVSFNICTYYIAAIKISMKTFSFRIASLLWDMFVIIDMKSDVINNSINIWFLRILGIKC